MAGETFETIAVNDPRAVVRGAHVVACATNSKVPVLSGEWLEPGQMVVTIANSDVISARHEVDETTFARASGIIINDWDSVGANRQVELSGPIAKGMVRRENVHELGDIVAGKAALRRDPGGIVFYKNNTGLAMQFARRHPAQEAPGRGHQPHHPDGVVRERKAAFSGPERPAGPCDRRSPGPYPYSTTSVAQAMLALFTVLLYRHPLPWPGWKDAWGAHMPRRWRKFGQSAAHSRGRWSSPVS
jgi:hypothetical protein